MPPPSTSQLIPMISVDSASSLSKLQHCVQISPPALPRSFDFIEIAAGKARPNANLRSHGRHCLATPPSCSWMREGSGRFHHLDCCAGASAGRESTGHTFGKVCGSDSPWRKSGFSSVPTWPSPGAMKGAERASGLPGDNGATGSPLAIAITNLSLSVRSDRGEVPVLRECSLSVPEGQFWMLLGPNGCGKSTLLKAMAGLLRPNGGQMYVVGPRSFVFQNPDHQVVMPTAEADVAFGSGRFNLPLEEVCKRVYESLDAVGMAEYAQRSVQTLSGGQKQRIAIAGALAESSRLLLLDELTTYLDSGDQIGVLEAVLKVVRGPQAVTALWVTHRLEELEYADGASYMENGRVVLSGSVEEIKKHIQVQQEAFFKGQGALR